MADHQPLVSVIIATYNYSTVLRCAVESVLLQTIQDFELLVIGDGCTDDSEAVVRSFGDERITWDNLPENTGNQGLPNNRGLALARGKYIAYLGHDDLWLPHHLELLTNTLETQDMLATASLALRFNNPKIGSRSIRNLNSNFAHFLPGTTMHRRELPEDLQWKHHNELVGQTTTGWDFSERLRALVGDKFMPTRQVTLLNFPSAFRPNSYRDKISVEQEHYLERIKSEPLLSYTVLLETINAANEGLYQRQGVILEGELQGESGEMIEAMRRLKGLEGDGRAVQSIRVIDDPLEYMLYYRLGRVSTIYRRLLGYWMRFRNSRWNPFKSKSSQVANGK